jgi:hypothetical protein
MSAFGQGFGCRPSRLEFSHPFKLDIQHLHVIPAQITERRGRSVLQIRAAFLQHNLPFWMASLVAHLLVLLIPIVAVLYPMMRFCLLCMAG